MLEEKVEHFIFSATAYSSHEKPQYFNYNVNSFLCNPRSTTQGRLDQIL
jgi:hypothetical protein